MKERIERRIKYMVKKDDAYAVAVQIKQQRLERRKSEYELKLRTAYSQLPRLSDIDDALSSLGSQLALSALAGGGKSIESLREKMTALNSEKEQLLKEAQIEPIKNDCNLCGDTGYLPNGKLCDCTKILAKRIFTERLATEMPLEDCRFDNFDLSYYPDGSSGGQNSRKRMASILKLCREYVDGFSPTGSQNLLFMGETGLGKTHLTLSIVSGVIDKGFDVIYGSAFNLFSQVEQEHFGNGSRSSYDAMLECDLLVIDDLGTEFASPFIQTTLYGIVNTRLLSKKPTIINTNLTMAEIEKRYTERIASRFIGCYTAKRFSGADVRQKRAMENL